MYDVVPIIVPGVVTSPVAALSNPAASS